MDDEVLVVVEVSAARRWMGVGTLLGVGVVVLYVAFSTPPALAWQLFLVITGLLALWMAERMRRATEHRLELTRAALRSSDGTTLVRIEEVEALERGLFAFKPSNGFLIRTRAPKPRGWQPGLWWRVGRRIGIGGVTSAGQAKAMSEIMAALLLERDGGPAAGLGG